LNHRLFRPAALALSVLAGGALAAATPASAASVTPALSDPHPVYMPAIGQAGNSALVPPAVDICQVLPTCPPGVAAGQPQPVNMAYFGGHVQVKPRIYMVFWGWGQAGAFDHTTAGRPANDPDGVAARMTNFVKALGGTQWAGVQSQYYQVDSRGNHVFIQNPRNQFGGVWWDNSNRTHANLSYLEIAQEAARGAQHFGITDFNNSQVIVAQPQKFEDGKFLSTGYCAWHDYTLQKAYPGVKQGISFTNMPYILNNAGPCGKDFVTPSSPAGDLDGVSIVLGHEIEETVTDPGAEAMVGKQQLGGWFDYQGAENGDKCAWVGDGLGAIFPIPGAAGLITGNDGRRYPVQSLWSNAAVKGAGYCAGAGTDLK
jgi:hypothetical protein